MRTTSLLIGILLTATTVTLIAGPAQAYGTSCATATRVLPGVYEGDVDSGSHWFRVAYTGAIANILLSHDGDVNLYVYAEANCTVGNHLCQSTQTSLPDACFGVAIEQSVASYVEVRYGSGSGEYTLVLGADPATNPKTVVDPVTANLCIVYNDENNDGLPQSHEILLTVSCELLNLKTTGCTLFNDRDDDNQLDPGEFIIGGACPGVGVQRNGDGTCTIFQDPNANGVRDAGENALQTLVCVNPQAYQKPNGETVVYDDKNNNNAEDPGEFIAVVGKYIP